MDPLVESIQESLELLSKYGSLCQKIRETPKNKEYYEYCIEAYRCYQRCHELVFDRITHLKDFKVLSTGLKPSILQPSQNQPSLLSVYDKLKAMLLNDTQIEDIRHEFYIYTRRTSPLTDLISNSWISINFLHNIINQTINTKQITTLIIEIINETTQLQFQQYRICPNHIKINSNLIEHEDTMVQIENKIEISNTLLPSEVLLLRERNSFDYIIIMTTDDRSATPNNNNVEKALLLFKKIAKVLTPTLNNGLYPSLFINIMDYNKWYNVPIKNGNQFYTSNNNNSLSRVNSGRSLTTQLTEDNNVNLDNALIGIHNQSNSCYMNSVIQSLLGSRDFTNIIFNSERDVTTKPRLITSQLLKLLIFIKQSSLTQHKPVSIEEFKHACATKCDDFKGNNQEDCAEFCQFLLDTLNDELKLNSPLLPNNPPTNDSINTPEKAWLQYSYSNNSPITQRFVGQLESKLHCQRCGKKKLTYETFSILSLPIPNVPNCNIMECFRQFFRPHQLLSPNQWFCESCKQNTDSTQQYLMTKKPQMLIIQLKRFNNHLNKNNCFIQYPVILDEKYTGFSEPSGTNGSPMFKYQLYSVVCHRGSINAGHYTTYVYKGNQKGWYYFDDTIYRPIQIPTEFITPDAYLLFYKLVAI